MENFNISKDVKMFTLIMVLGVGVTILEALLQSTNLSPVMAIVMLATIVFSFNAGMYVALINLILTGLQHGFGLQAVIELIAYTVFVVAFALTPFVRSISIKNSQEFFRGVFALAFLMIPFTVIFITIINLSEIFHVGVELLPKLLEQVPYDALLIWSNVLFTVILTPILYPPLVRLRRKLNCL